MNYSILHLLILIIGAGLYSCAHEDHNETEKKIEIIETSTPHDLILNNGEKWEVNASMKSVIDQIGLTTNEFSGITVQDHVDLSDSLSILISELTMNCNMKGQAHDELHKWLLPFIDLNKQLKKIDQLNKGKELTTELKHELTIFNNYFQ